MQRAILQVQEREARATRGDFRMQTLELTIKDGPRNDHLDVVQPLVIHHGRIHGVHPLARPLPNRMILGQIRGAQ